MGVKIRNLKTIVQLLYDALLQRKDGPDVGFLGLGGRVGFGVGQMSARFAGGQEQRAVAVNGGANLLKINVR